MMAIVFVLYALNHTLQVNQGKTGSNAWSVNTGHMKNVHSKRTYTFAVYCYTLYTVTTAPELGAVVTLSPTLIFS